MTLVIARTFREFEDFRRAQDLSPHKCRHISSRERLDVYDPIVTVIVVGNALASLATFEAIATAEARGHPVLWWGRS